MPPTDNNALYVTNPECTRVLSSQQTATIFLIHLCGLSYTDGFNLSSLGKQDRKSIKDSKKESKGKKLTG